MGALALLPIWTPDREKGEGANQQISSQAAFTQSQKGRSVTFLQRLARSSPHHGESILQDCSLEMSSQWLLEQLPCTIGEKGKELPCQPESLHLETV